MPGRPLVLIHGYSSNGAAFDRWRDALVSLGRDVRTIHVGSYRTLTNEVTLRDVAEGLDRALDIRAGLAADEPFDAIVHSTGSLVLRAWLTHYAGRKDRLRHFIGLAPANFGSPMAHKGRSWLGALFKGNKTLGPDFLEAGDRILGALELGSRFQWDLAHADLLGDQPFYGPTRKTPWAFTIVGTEGFGGIEGFFTEPGTDGVVRWAGAALDLRKIELDLTRAGSDARRVRVSKWSNTDVPLMLSGGHSHSTILSEPREELVSAVEEALGVSTAAQYEAWRERYGKKPASADEWQQFVVRAVDERGDPIQDFNMQLFTWDAKGNEKTLQAFSADVHANSDDRSLRCFHVRLADIRAQRVTTLGMRIMASSGTEMVAYRGVGAQEGEWDGVLDLSALGRGAEVTFFYPFTTTFVEVRMNREPMPPQGANRVYWFGGQEP